MVLVLLIVGLLMAGAHASPISRAHVTEEDCLADSMLPAEQISVFLSVSPLAKTTWTGRIEQRQIQLNWYNGTVLEGDTVGLYDADPKEGSPTPLVSISPPSYTGFYQTNVQFGFPVDRNTTLINSCLGYWIGYVRNGTVIASNCLKMRPTWMWDNRAAIGSVPLFKLFLPGTHNAGSFRQYRGHASDTVFTRYLICQEEDIWTQLAYGIRYLDIRIGYYPDQAEQFWLNHNYARIHPISALISDLKEFLQATREVVILDFHRFPIGFNPPRNREIHSQLVQLLEQELGSFMVPEEHRADATLDTLWSLNKTLVIAYADEYTRTASPFLWPSVPQEWGDKKTVSDLFTYLSGVNERRAGFNYLWAAMAELTPSSMDVVFRPKEGLRKLAAASNRNVTTWYRDLWWKSTNIVAVDFFQSTDIIDVAVRANLKRVECTRSWQSPLYRTRNSRRSSNFRSKTESRPTELNGSPLQRISSEIRSSAQD